MEKKTFRLHCFIFLFVLFTVTPVVHAQKSIDAVLKKYNKESIPYISVDSLFKTQNNSILIDSREKEEFKTSHIKNAIYGGYTDFDISVIKDIPKDQRIVVYCSLGVRSEVIARKLKKEGYTQVYNLYGGIFQWKNKNFPVVDTKGKETEKVHAFSKEWSVYLKKGTKVYE